MPTSVEPRGELSIRTLAMPANTNPSGDIFGGWVVSQMDLAGGYVVKKYAPIKMVTVAITEMEFISRVHVGDFVCCYSEITKLGRTSVHVHIETWAQGHGQDEVRRKVTEGLFVYVSVDLQNIPVPLLELKG